MPPLAGAGRQLDGGGSMSMERSRRDRFSTVAPSAAELAAATLVAGLFLLLTTPLVVQGVVGWARSGDFVWPDRDLLDSYGGLVRGRFGGGLRPGAAEALLPDAVMWGLTFLGEVLVLGAAVVVGVWMRDLTGTSSRHGLATATQAAEALGLQRLRRSAAVIRPDLCARPGRGGSVGRR